MSYFPVVIKITEALTGHQTKVWDKNRSWEPNGIYLIPSPISFPDGVSFKILHVSGQGTIYHVRLDA